MSITLKKVKTKRDLASHIASQSDFDVLGVVYGTKAEVNTFISSQSQQSNRTWGVVLVSLKGTPNIDG
jgi:hypothetical protein